MDHVLSGVKIAVNTPQLHRILGGVDPRTPPDKMLEALRYFPVTSIRCVILGQGPYPAPGVADGLAFSSADGSPMPDSLKAIFKCLARSGLRPERAFDSGDLRPWAVQGVLLLNTALTTRADAIWRPYVHALVEHICAANHACGRRIPFMLWGDEAQRHADLVTKYQHVLMTWTDPSPLSDSTLPEALQFRMCNHFEMCPGIVWDNLAPVVALTDGSCPLNGHEAARASFAVVLGGGPFRKTILRGEVQPFEHVHDGSLRCTARAVRPSNNRGELLGLIHAFQALIDACVLGDIEVVSDSDISIKTLLEWLPNRIRKGTESQLKNFDLVMIAWKLLGVLRKQAHSVTLTHVRSHQKVPLPGATARARFIHLGNALADKHAALALGEGEPPFKLINPPC